MANDKNSKNLCEGLSEQDMIELRNELVNALELVANFAMNIRDILLKLTNESKEE